MAHILLIEDEEQVRDLIRHVLENAGHEVVVAADGSIGGELFRQRPADLIITDILMPEKEGLEVIRELRRDNARVPILAMSGGGSRRAFDPLPVASMLGADRTLAKPLDMKTLVRTVQEMLDAVAGAGR